MRLIIPGGRPHSESPLTSPEPSKRRSVSKRGSNKKRQRIDSDFEDFGSHDYEQGKGDGPPASPSSAVASTSSARRSSLPLEQVEETDVTPMEAQHDPADHRQRHRQASDKGTQELRRKRLQKGTDPRAKGKGKAEGPPSKKKAKKTAVLSDDDDDFLEHFDESDEMATESEGGSEPSGHYEKPKRKGRSKARGGGTSHGTGGRSIGSKKGAKATEAIKAKDEGWDRSGPAHHLKARVPKPPPLNLDDMDVDVVGEQPLHPEGTPPSQPPTSALSGVASPSNADSNTKDATSVPKKRKLPTIKKNKIAVDSSTPNTPLSTTASAKAIAPDSSLNSVIGEVKPAAPGTRVPAARLGAADLDLTNKSVYDQLFKGAGNLTPGSNRRAKEEDRRRELNAMKEEWKSRREQEQSQTRPFDLQSEFEKISRFEERLRVGHSAALYPHLLAGKWREIWERNRAREQKGTTSSQQPQVPPPVDGVKKEDGRVAR